MMKTMICALLLATPVLAAQIDINENSVYTSKHDARLTFKQGTFSVESEDGSFDIAPHNVRGSVKGLNDDAVESLLSKDDIYFRLNYEAKILDSNLRLRGGMPPKQQEDPAKKAGWAAGALVATGVGAAVGGPVGAAAGLAGAGIAHGINKATGAYKK